MNSFDPKDAQDLAKPIKKGTLCAALYSADKKWYRAKVVGYSGSQLEVAFVDFGTQTQVKETDLRKLPASVMSFEP